MLEKWGIWVGAKPGIQQETAGRPAGLHRADREQGLVSLEGAKSSQHRTGLGTKMMAVGPAGLVADPLALAILEGNPPVSRERHFCGDPRTPSAHALKKPSIQMLGFCREKPAPNVNACSA
jgi:hypothetical protein